MKSTSKEALKNVQKNMVTVSYALFLISAIGIPLFLFFIILLLKLSGVSGNYGNGDIIGFIILPFLISLAAILGVIAALIGLSTLKWDLYLISFYLFCILWEIYSNFKNLDQLNPAIFLWAWAGFGLLIIIFFILRKVKIIQ